MTGFNPKFSFGQRRKSHDMDTATPHETEPLLAESGEVETNGQQDENPFYFLDPEYQATLPVFNTIHL